MIYKMNFHISIRSLFAVLLIAALNAPMASAQDGAYSKGWIMFDDSVATVLELRTAQLERLREIDRRYQADYVALGGAPRSNSNYLPLTERRKLAGGYEDDLMDDQPQGADCTVAYQC